MKLMNLVILMLFVSQAMAMEFNHTKLVLWKKGETIEGDEFLAFDEKVVDYIATLKRPEGNALSTLKYDCEAKIRAASPDVTLYNTSPSVRGWVAIRVVYDLKNCTPLL